MYGGKLMMLKFFDEMRLCEYVFEIEEKDDTLKSIKVIPREGSRIPNITQEFGEHAPPVVGTIINPAFFLAQPYLQVRSIAQDGPNRKIDKG
jgi:hypothetical protein